MFPLLMISALLTGCETDRELIAETEKKKAEQSAVERIAQVAVKQVPLPDQPPECRKKVKAGVDGSDKADEATVKYDRALGQANEKAVRCSDWYDRVKKSHSGGR